MSYALILCEKPSAADNFARALGGKSGTYQGRQYRIVAAAGHLYELDEPENLVPKALYERYRDWDLANLPWDVADFEFKRRIHRKPGTRARLKEITEAVRGADEIVIGTDVDPSGEGSLIGWEIINELGLARGRTVTRMFFADEAPASIQAAFTGRKQLLSAEADPDYRKAYYRERWDLLSMQWTRMASRLVGVFGLSVRQGRLKSAMVRLVGDQLDAIAKYQRKPYFELRYRDENGNVFTNPKQDRYELAAQVVLPNEREAVQVLGSNLKHVSPPRLIDLSQLSAKLAPRGISSKALLDTYQNMYHAQVVSYPRTEDKKITLEQFNELLPLANKIAAVVGVDTSLLTVRTPRGSHVGKGLAHGANRPGPNVPASLAAIKADFGPVGVAIYETLAHSYLAMLCEDKLVEVTKAQLERKPEFKSTASVTVKPGWSLIYSDDSDDEDEGASRFGPVADPFVYEGANAKPTRPTVRWLMRELEHYNVGTGATRVSTLSEVCNDKGKNQPLLSEHKGALALTDLGEISWQLLPGTVIGSLDLTKQVLQEMDEVAKNQLDPIEGLGRIAHLVERDLQQMKQLSGRITMPDTYVKSQYATDPDDYFTGNWNGEAVRFKRKFRGKRISDADCMSLLAGEQITIDGLTSKLGNTYGVIAELQRKSFVNDQGKTVPYVGIEQVGWAPTRSVPKQWCGHVFTPKEISALENGMKVELTDCVSSRTGKGFSAVVHMGEDENGRYGIIPEWD